MNDQDHHAQVRELFHELAECDESECRSRLEASEAPAAVLADVRALLDIAGDDATDGAFAESALGAVNNRLILGGERDQADALIGTTIDCYRIRAVLGVGGMGTVYVADQEGEIERSVALKIIKLGMDSRSIVGRFEAERQALAMMNHEGIAKVFDCGTTGRGQPYFVMELVEGVPIARFCREQSLPLNDRLELVRQLCEAVHHAHQKGVVHRDLKPGNVLASRVGGRLGVKVIDFGLAKAMRSEEDAATLFTEVGQVVGTLEFMAPEQADLSNRDVDTRADVYAIGVLLFQLLVDELPFSAKLIREDLARSGADSSSHREPPRPSTRVSRGKSGPSSALYRALRTDLDWIVCKAMDPVRDRRYDSASALAEDLRRFAAHEPLDAGPPSTVYRAQKLLRRYRPHLLIGATVMVIAAVGGVLALTQWMRAERTVDEFEQLAGVVQLEAAVAAEQRLDLAWPEHLPEMRRWEVNHWNPLAAIRPRLRRSVEMLRTRVLPWSDEERQRDREGHPRAEELEVLQRDLAAVRYADSIRRDPASLETDAVSDAVIRKMSGRLYEMAWSRVAPDEPDRAVWGEEAQGLAYARALLRHAKRERVSACTVQKVIAYACLANGLHEEAVDAATKAVKLAGGSKFHIQGHQEDLERIRGLAASPEAELLRLEAEEAALASIVYARRTWSFRSGSEKFLHDALVSLLARIDELESAQVEHVSMRIRWAEFLEQIATGHPDAPVSWDEVRATLANSERYDGAAIDLRPGDMHGLVPLGANPVTGLLEFYHVRSAWDGQCDPRTIEIPRHDEEGRIHVGDDAGIVFVLLPGGSFMMGAQARDKDSPNYDRHALADETPHRVTLAPFLLARHEVTKGQWRRLALAEDVDPRPSAMVAGAFMQRRGVTEKNPVTWAHPVENVSWNDCRRLAAGHRLTLPTEAQWEYACRAGTTTPAPWGDEPARFFANLGQDAAIERAQPGSEASAEFDGYDAQAPVGQFRPNAFGIYDMIGNVAEWCLDPVASYRRRIRAGDGLRMAIRHEGPEQRVLRGYSFEYFSIRVAYRYGRPQETNSHDRGVRFARRLHPTEPIKDKPPLWQRWR